MMTEKNITGEIWSRIENLMLIIKLKSSHQNVKQNTGKEELQEGEPQGRGGQTG